MWNHILQRVIHDFSQGSYLTLILKLKETALFTLTHILTNAFMVVLNHAMLMLM